MVLVKKAPDIEEKLSILSRDSKYDLACACATQDHEHRHRSKDGKWIYPVILPNGGTTYLLKTLFSNECVNNCKYCPLRLGNDSRRLRFQEEEIVRAFWSYYRSGKVSGLFLSSGVMGSADKTMERINRVAQILRKECFRGYIHLKVIPGSSEGAIRETLSLASAVSLNIETPGEKNFNTVCTTKNYLRDIIQPMKLISRLTEKGAPFYGVKHTTQFVVGAAKETDEELVKYSWGLYKRLGLSRIYFSAYQRGAGDSTLPGEKSDFTNEETLTREHRLYQVDWLIRKYGFKLEEIPFEKGGNLSLTIDPKERWAQKHPEFFPVNVNQADEYNLLRIPGLGQITVERILKRRRFRRISRLEDLGLKGQRLKKASSYVIF